MKLNLLKNRLSMENEKKFKQLITMLSKLTILEEIVLIGSWAFNLYRDIYENAEYLSPLRTRDVDFCLEPNPQNRRKMNIVLELKKLGFDLDRKGDKGYMIFINPLLNIEFLTPLKGKDRNKPFEINEWGINTQQLRYLDILLNNNIRIKKFGTEIIIPSPSAYIVQKIMILHKRKKIKRERDINQIEQLIHTLNDDDILSEICEIYKNMIVGWQKTFNENREKHLTSHSNIILKC